MTESKSAVLPLHHRANTLQFEKSRVYWLRFELQEAVHIFCNFYRNSAFRMLAHSICYLTYHCVLRTIRSRPNAFALRYTGAFLQFCVAKGGMEEGISGCLWPGCSTEGGGIDEHAEFKTGLFVIFVAHAARPAD